MGDDQWGGKYKEHLHTMGVDVTHVHVTKDTSTGIAQISVADNGDNQIVIVPGANNHLSKADVDNAKDLLKKADVLIGQLETPYETTLEAFKLNDGVRLLQIHIFYKTSSQSLYYGLQLGHATPTTLAKCKVDRLQT